MSSSEPQTPQSAEGNGRPDTGELLLGEGGPYEILHGNVEEVIREWKNLVEGEPWIPPSPARLVNSLPEILPPLFRHLHGGAAHIDKELSDLIAQQHGSWRREDAVPLSALANEWNHLKRACWTVLRRRDPEDRFTSRTISRLDVLIDDAIGYSLRGYYRPELDQLRGQGLERRADDGDRRRGSGDRRESS